MSTETKITEERITFYQREYVEGCATCDHIKASGGFGPNHDASRGCESGKHNHCTCDFCF